MDRRYRTARVATPDPRGTFSYYGGKSKIVGRYPAPRFPLIIEPFAGAAAYAWRHRRGHQVWLNDVDAVTVAIWTFLQSDDALSALQALPLAIEPGQLIDEIIPADASMGLNQLIRAELSRGTQGRVDIASKATAFGAYYYWPRLFLKFSKIAAEVRMWQVTQLDYSQLPNVEATWFIDPPYNNKAGRRYRHASVDYAALAEWCRTRRGQVIVCENAGATWLPFQPLVGPIGRHTRTTDTGEVIWVNASSDDNCAKGEWDNACALGATSPTS